VSLIKTYLLSLMLIVAPVPVFGDEGGTARELVLEVYPKWYSHEDMTLQGKFGVEMIARKRDWIEYFARPSIAYALYNSWALHGGLGFYYTDYKGLRNTGEWRPFVGISHFTDFAEKWSFSSYFRVEERYHYTLGSDQRSETTRLRLRFRSAYRFNPISVPSAWHKVTLGLEGFKSNNTDTTLLRTYDYETRATLSVERSLRKQRKIRFELAWKYQTPPTQISDAAINTVYFKIQYFPSWGKRLLNRLHDRDIDE
jgi:hypothetical protein